MLGRLSALHSPSVIAAAPGTPPAQAGEAQATAGFAGLLQAAVSPDQSSLWPTAGDGGVASQPLTGPVRSDAQSADAVQQLSAMIGIANVGQTGPVDQTAPAVAAAHESTVMATRSPPPAFDDSVEIERQTDPATGDGWSADAAQQVIAMIGIVPAVQPGRTDGSAPAIAPAVDDSASGNREVAATAPARADGALHDTAGPGIVAPTSALRAEPRLVASDRSLEGNPSVRTRRDDAARKLVADGMRSLVEHTLADQAGTRDTPAMPDSPNPWIVPSSTTVAPPVDPPATPAVAGPAPELLAPMAAPVADTLPRVPSHGSREALVHTGLGGESLVPASGPRAPVSGTTGMPAHATAVGAAESGAHGTQESPHSTLVPESTDLAPSVDTPTAFATAAPTPAPAPMTRTVADALSPSLQHAIRDATVHPAVGSESFAPALGLQVSTLASDGVQHARLHLNPAELGPITVRIALDGSGARVDFQADAALTRSAIEASLPALASALHEAGLTLTGGGVFQQSQDRPADGQARSGQPSARPQDAQARDLPEDAAAAMRPIPLRRGLVDLVA